MRTPPSPGKGQVTLATMPSVKAASSSNTTTAVAPRHACPSRTTFRTTHRIPRSVLSSIRDEMWNARPRPLFLTGGPFRRGQMEVEA